MSVQLTDYDYAVLEKGELLQYAEVNEKAFSTYLAFCECIAPNFPGIAAALIKCQGASSNYEAHLGVTITTPSMGLIHLLSLKGVVNEEFQKPGNFSEYSEKLKKYNERKEYFANFKNRIKEAEIQAQLSIEQKEIELNNFKSGWKNYVTSLKAQLKKERAVKADEWVSPDRL